jgi:AraC-like DNA-binding protein
MAVREFSTEGFAPRDQFDAWREWFSPILEISTASRRPERFPATNKVWDLGGPIVSCVSGPPALVRRTRPNIAKAPVDHWVVSCCRKGSTTIQTDKALLQAQPGMPFVWSLGVTSESERSQVDRVQLLLPRDAFQDIESPLDALLGSVVSHDLGAVLGAYILALEEWLPHVPSDALPRLGLAVESMLAACIAPSSDRLHSAADEMDGFRAEQVRRTIRRHLKSPSLRPEMLCRMLCMSRSSLYRLFEGCGGIARYIQRQRLQYAYAALSDPQNRQPVAVLGEELCFSDLSTFSRAFRREFGCSPRDVRSAALRGWPVEPAVWPRQAPEFGCFADFLHHSDYSELAPG